MFDGTAFPIPRNGGQRCQQAIAPLLAVAVTMAIVQSRPALAQATPTPLTEAQRAHVEQQLQELRTMRDEMSRNMQQFDARIGALEEELHGAMPQNAPVAAVTGGAAPATVATGGTGTAPAARATPQSTVPPEKWGSYQDLKGITLADNDWGNFVFNLTAYMRYLNQTATDTTYTDYFGRTYKIDRRQDFQLAKVQMTFRGWIFDPKFNWNFYVWTSNASQGQGAQVVSAGNLHYDFSDAFQLYVGIHSLPSTRSTNRSFPYWLRNDNRPIADEFFRGSYTQGIWAQGTIRPGLEYRAMLANNLSALGVSAGQLDAKIDTVSGALVWMPTTGEFGPLKGFGDYEHHDKLATLLGVHYTTSTEDRQSQPNTEGIENTQLRLSDGTIIFAPNAFNTNGQISQARYRMLDFEAGAKYGGYSLEAEYYWRWLDQFHYTGIIPVTSLYDTGFQLQASAMLIPNRLQAYVSGSKIFGQYGDPYDVGLGLNWFPFRRKEMRINVMGIDVHNSPVGYTAYPTLVGMDGWVFLTDVALNL